MCEEFKKGSGHEGCEGEGPKKQNLQSLGESINSRCRVQNEFREHNRSPINSRPCTAKDSERKSWPWRFSNGGLTALFDEEKARKWERKRETGADTKGTLLRKVRGGGGS